MATSVRDSEARARLAEREKAEAAQRMQTQSRALLQLATSDLSELPDQILEISRIVNDVLGAVRLEIRVLESSGGSFRDLLDIPDRHPKTCHADHIPADCLTQTMELLCRERVLVIADSAVDPRMEEWRSQNLELPSSGVILLAAIRRDGRVKGWLQVLFPQVERLVAVDEIAFAGQLADHVAMLLDRAERKSLEKQLAHAQKLDAIGTLAGGIAHRLNRERST